MTAIGISRLHFPVTTLGPGNRVGIWFQGCSIRCPGCISADTWASGRGMTTIDEVLRAIQRWIPEAEGFTISGGEPFDQPDALAELLRGIRRMSDSDVLVYSGHPLETIERHVVGMDGLIDVLITDPFDIALSQTRALRGSDNQRLHMLTELGKIAFTEYESPSRQQLKTFDVMMDASGEAWMAGIPGRDDFNRLSQLFESQQHSIFTTQDRSSEAVRRKQHDQILP